MVITKILTGIILLVAGQKFFWFFTGIVGFLVGSEIALNFFYGLPYWQGIVAGLACGLLGILLAVFLQSVAVISAGFLAGVYIFLGIWDLYKLGITDFWGIFLVASGFMGSVFMMVFFNPALIVISSFIGAMLIVQNIPVPPFFKLILLGILFIIGMIIQSNQLSAKS